MILHLHKTKKVDLSEPPFLFYVSFLLQIRNDATNDFFRTKELSLVPSLREERDDCDVVAIRVSNVFKNIIITRNV